MGSRKERVNGQWIEYDDFGQVRPEGDPVLFKQGDGKTRGVQREFIGENVLYDQTGEFFPGLKRLLTAYGTVQVQATAAIYTGQVDISGTVAGGGSVYGGIGITWPPQRVPQTGIAATHAGFQFGSTNGLTLKASVTIPRGGNTWRATATLSMAGLGFKAGSGTPGNLRGTLTVGWTSKSDLKWLF